MSTQLAALDASQYDLPIPTVDGLKADKVPLVFTGSLDLDRTDLEHLDLANLSGEAELYVKVVCTGKSASFRYVEGEAGEMVYRTHLRVVALHGRR